MGLETGGMTAQRGVRLHRLTDFGTNGVLFPGHTQLVCGLVVLEVELVAGGRQGEREARDEKSYSRPRPVVARHLTVRMPLPNLRTPASSGLPVYGHICSDGSVFLAKTSAIPSPISGHTLRVAHA